MVERFAVDNSIVMAWCFSDEESSYADSVLKILKTAIAFVPSIWPLEAGNSLLAAERKKRLSQSQISNFFSILDILPISVEQETPGRMRNEIFSLARKHLLSTYDASYLDLAIRLNIPLAIQDIAL
jgi:predicted nucleic acid-binding protein